MTIKIGADYYPLVGHVSCADAMSAAAFDASLAKEERQIREMLGRWVSEAEPVLVYQRGELVGLTVAGIPEGCVAPIVLSVAE